MAYDEYKGQNIGRLLYFLYKFNHIFDTCTYGNGIIYYSETEIIGTYTWDGLTDLPIFEFGGRYESLNDCKDRIMERALEFNPVNKVCEHHKNEAMVDDVCQTCKEKEERDRNFKKMLDSYVKSDSIRSKEI